MDVKQQKEELLNAIKRREELKRQSVLERYEKKLRQAENQKEEERRKKLTQMIEKRQRITAVQNTIKLNKMKSKQEFELEREYLSQVQDQMERMATKENKLGEEVKKLLPVKLHLRSW